MEKQVKTKLTNDEIINIAFDAVEGCYGVVGVTSKGVDKLDLLTKKDAKKGISVLTTSASGAFNVEINLILSRDVKISEAMRECQKVVRYTLNKITNNNCKKVDIFVIGVK